MNIEEFFNNPKYGIIIGLVALAVFWWPSIIGKKKLSLFKLYMIHKTRVLIYMDHFLIKNFNNYSLTQKVYYSMMHIAYHAFCDYKLIFGIWNDCNYCPVNIPCQTGDFREIEKGLIE